MTKFVFDAATFVRPGDETDPGEWSDETRGEIAKLRNLYPELAHWGDLALGGAFGEMSQDVLSVGWAHWMFEEREEFFSVIAAGARRAESGMAESTSRRSNA